MHQNVELELIEIQNEGTCIRFCPIEHINVLGTDEKNLEAFADSLDEMIVRRKLIFDIIFFNCYEFFYYIITIVLKRKLLSRRSNRDQRSRKT